MSYSRYSVNKDKSDDVVKLTTNCTDALTRNTQAYYAFPFDVFTRLFIAQFVFRNVVSGGRWRYLCPTSFFEVRNRNARCDPILPRKKNSCKNSKNGDNESKAHSVQSCQQQAWSTLYEESNQYIIYILSSLPLCILYHSSKLSRSAPLCCRLCAFATLASVPREKQIKYSRQSSNIKISVASKLSRSAPLCCRLCAFAALASVPREKQIRQKYQNRLTTSSRAVDCHYNSEVPFLKPIIGRAATINTCIVRHGGR